MSSSDPVVTGQPSRAAPWVEHRGWWAPGVPAVVAGVVAVLVGIGLIVVVGQVHPGSAVEAVLIVVAVLLFVTASLGFRGLMPVVAGESRVIQLFGSYRGSVREPGLKWVNPFADKRRVSVRFRNHETNLAKVNDADGNPIEIAAVLVWQVEDTAKALYAVDDFPQFVAIQAETAVRHIASSYPYTSQNGELSLRENAEEITRRLSAEIAARVRPAGVTIIESRLTRLSYASEIAQAMLRQQQANAVVGARRRSSKARWAWSSSPSSDWRRRTSSTWTRSGRPRWCRTSSWSSAASRQPSRS